MSYLALARKWRPQTFTELVGQEPINKALIKSLSQQRLHHAYLFTGTRGVGKTSIARLLAKAFNCLQGITPTPCLTCEICQAIEKNCFIDLLEIDAASKTRIEDTRELLDNVQYVPNQGRYKIYLIDEVHMLSQHSFNALLKTLEEPPNHVKFILATTDPQKLPITILSRCLQFNLRPISAQNITAKLEHILIQEQISFEKAVPALLAKAAHGSMRDALSLLDYAIASSTDTLNLKELTKLLGYSNEDHALNLIKALVESDGNTIINIAQNIEVEGLDFNHILDEVLILLHRITIHQIVHDNNIIDNDLTLLSSQLTAEDLQLFYQIGLKGRSEIQLAPSLRIGFEMTLIRMLAFKLRPLNGSVAQNNRINSSLNKQLSESDKASSALCVTPKPTSHTDHKHVVSGTHEWSDIIQALKLRGLTLNAAENAQWIDKIDNQISLNVASGHRSLFTTIVIQRLEQALSQYYQAPIKLNINFDAPIDSSPAQKKKAILRQQQQDNTHQLNIDSFFQTIKQEFQAELVNNSIEGK